MKKKQIARTLAGVRALRLLTAAATTATLATGAIAPAFAAQESPENGFNSKNASAEDLSNAIFFWAKPDVNGKDGVNVLDATLMLDIVLSANPGAAYANSKFDGLPLQNNAIFKGSLVLGDPRDGALNLNTVISTLRAVAFPNGGATNANKVFYVEDDIADIEAILAGGSLSEEETVYYTALLAELKNAFNKVKAGEIVAADEIANLIKDLKDAASSHDLPGIVKPQPSETTPTDTTPTPTDTTPAPTDTTPAPTDTTPAPTDTTPAPTDTTPAPTDTTPTETSKTSDTDSSGTTVTTTVTSSDSSGTTTTPEATAPTASDAKEAKANLAKLIEEAKEILAAHAGELSDSGAALSDAIAEAESDAASDDLDTLNSAITKIFNALETAKKELNVTAPPVTTAPSEATSSSTTVTTSGGEETDSAGAAYKTLNELLAQAKEIFRKNADNVFSDGIYSDGGAFSDAINFALSAANAAHSGGSANGELLSDAATIKSLNDAIAVLKAAIEKAEADVKAYDDLIAKEDSAAALSDAVKKFDELAELIAQAKALYNANSDGAFNPKYNYSDGGVFSDAIKSAGKASDAAFSGGEIIYTQEGIASLNDAINAIGKAIEKAKTDVEAYAKSDAALKVEAKFTALQDLITKAKELYNGNKDGAFFSDATAGKALSDAIASAGKASDAAVSDGKFLDSAGSILSKGIEDLKEAYDKAEAVVKEFNPYFSDARAKKDTLNGLITQLKALYGEYGNVLASDAYDYAKSNSGGGLDIEKALSDAIKSDGKDITAANATASDVALLDAYIAKAQNALKSDADAKNAYSTELSKTLGSAAAKWTELNDLIVSAKKLIEAATTYSDAALSAGYTESAALATAIVSAGNLLEADSSGNTSANLTTLYGVVAALQTQIDAYLSSESHIGALSDALYKFSSDAADSSSTLFYEFVSGGALFSDGAVLSEGVISSGEADGKDNGAFASLKTALSSIVSQISAFKFETTGDTTLNSKVAEAEKLLIASLKLYDAANNYKALYELISDAVVELDNGVYDTESAATLNSALAEARKALGVAWNSDGQSYKVALGTLGGAIADLKNSSAPE